MSDLTDAIDLWDGILRQNPGSDLAYHVVLGRVR